MRLGALEGFDHALTYGNGGHHDDELGEAVFLVELVDRADVHIGLAGARLHLDGEVAEASVCKLLGSGEAILLLDFVEVVSKLAR